ncbi:MAG: hypothetical protein ABGZ53_10090 [Fuerstiella sp.]
MTLSLRTLPRPLAALADWDNMRPPLSRIYEAVGIHETESRKALVVERARSFGQRGETPKVLATSATVSISKLNVDAALAAGENTPLTGG